MMSTRRYKYSKEGTAALMRRLAIRLKEFSARQMLEAVWEAMPAVPEGCIRTNLSLMTTRDGIVESPRRGYFKLKEQ